MNQFGRGEIEKMLSEIKRSGIRNKKTSRISQYHDQIIHISFLFVKHHLTYI